MEKNTGAILLAGGRSSRLKKDKAFLSINGLTLAERAYQTLAGTFPEVVVVANDPRGYRELGINVVPDIIPGRGPLGGIHAGLTASQYPQSFVVACDMPFFSPSLALEMARVSGEYDVVVPREGEYFQPLHAIYGKGCLPVIEEAIKDGPAKVVSFYPRVRVCSYTDSRLMLHPERIFFNVNTEADWAEVQRIAEEG